MHCSTTRPTGKGGCQRGAVTQAACSRKARHVRRTSGGKLLHLCDKCDKSFGPIVGELVEESATEDRVYHAHRFSGHRTGEVYYENASPDRRWVEMHGLDEPIVEVRVREWQDGDPPSPYWGWIDAEEPDRYIFVWPSEGQLNMCFPYGPEVEEERGRGRKVHLVVEERGQPGPHDHPARVTGHRG